MSNRLTVISIGLAVSLFSAIAWAQEAPPVANSPIANETKAVSGELNDAQKAEVDNFLKACAQRFAGAATSRPGPTGPAAVEEARRKALPPRETT